MILKFFITLVLLSSATTCWTTTVAAAAAPPDEVAASTQVAGSYVFDGNAKFNTNLKPSPDTHITFNAGNKIYIDMNTLNEFVINYKLVLGKEQLKDLQAYKMKFEIMTLSPQFDILDINASSTVLVNVDAKNFIEDYNSVRLSAKYIGHARLRAVAIRLTSSNKTLSTYMFANPQEIDITVVRSQGIWDTLFIISVSVLIFIGYINIGATIDVENMKNMLKQPGPLVVGLIISVVVMPIASWFIAGWLLGDHLIYRVGSFVFACGPAASASSLWAGILDADKELAVGLQVVSTMAALITMPLLLFLMDLGLSREGAYYTVQVPYSRLISTLFALLCALFVGWYFLGRNERSRKISQRVFRPLLISILLFIVIFSAFVYWYLYSMFDWTITLTALMITMITYTLSGVLAMLCGCDMEHAVTISITSSYKHSGIAFCVLLVAFEAPDTYIAFVPCLTQVLTTSLSLYIVQTIKVVATMVQRRGQPAAIQAQVDVEASNKQSETCCKKPVAGSETDSKSDDKLSVEFNMTDAAPGSPRQQSEPEQETPVTEAKRDHGDVKQQKSPNEQENKK